MRNLKRVLSLALASVMLLGMMAVGAGAADKKATDLTDMDKVTNKAAVSLLVDLGIIAGKPDGTFAPTESVDRATMAKLVYFVMQGTADESIYKGSSDLKDVTGHWAEGFINYCYSLDIIAGDGTGNFLPGNKVNTVGAAKMLLVALGYDAADRGYVNDSQWAIKIMKDAQSNGLLKGIEQGASEELTRDSAAQMIYNALFATTVEAVYSRDNGEKYVSSYEKLDTLGVVTYKLVEVTAKLTSVNGTTVTVTTTKPEYDGNAATVKGISDLPANSADIGKTVVYYITADGKLISTTLGLSSKTTTYTVPDTLKVGHYTSDKGSVMKFLKDNSISLPATEDVAVVNNGTSADKSAADAMKDMATGTTAAAGSKVEIVGTAKVGDIITLIDTDTDGVIDRISITRKSAVKLSGDAVTKTTNDVLTVRVPGVTGLSNYVDAKNVKGYEGLKENDIVLFYKDAATAITHIELAEKLTGQVSSTKGDTVTIAGKTYKASGINDFASSNLATYIAAGNTGVDMTAYLDNNGNIIKIDNDKAAAQDYAVVAEAVWVSGGGVASKSYLEAKIVLMDGTTEIVKIAKINDVDTISTSATTVVKQTLYKYLVNKDGNYELTAVAEATQIAGNITKGVASVTAGGKTVTFNNATVFVYATTASGKTTYTVYTGYKNAPSVKGDDNFVSANTLTGAAKYVFVTATAANVGDTTSNYVYITDKVYSTSGSGSDRVYTFGGASNGDTTDGVQTKSTTVRDALTAANGLYEVEIDADGYVTKVNNAPAALSGMLGVAAANASEGTASMKVGTNATLSAGVYTYDDDTVVYVIDGSDFYEGSMNDLKKDYTAYIMKVGTTGADQWAIKTAYIIVNNEV